MTTKPTRLLVALGFLFVLSCSTRPSGEIDGGATPDSGSGDAGVADAGAPDSGGMAAGTDSGMDDGGAPDSGEDGGTYGVGSDAGEDGGAVDSGFDGGIEDGGTVDGGTEDGGSADASVDGGSEDGGSSDGGANDGGGQDGGITGPVIDSFTPSAGVVGDTVTIVGSGFSTIVSDVAVTFNGTAAAVNSSSETEISTAVPSGATSGPISVTVNGQTATSTEDFDVEAPNPAPTLDSLSPTSGLAGTTSLLLEALGSDFVSASEIQINGSARTTSFVSSTEITTQLTSSDLSATGTLTVTVFTPSPGGGMSGSVDFDLANPSPSISSLSPSSINAGSGAQTLTVNGSGFDSASVVQLNGNNRTTTFESDTEVKASLLAADVENAGSATVTVVNPTPGGGTSTGVTLTISPAPNQTPAISSLSPCGLVAGAAAFTLTVGGTNFVNGATATFDGQSVDVTFVSATELQLAVTASLVASAPSSDEVDVVVTNPAPGGGASNSETFGIATQTSTLSSNVQPIFSDNCTGCHGGSHPDENMSLTSGDTASNLIGVNCDECSSPTRARVLACGPAATESYLVAKITGTDMCSGVRMPDGAPALSTTDQQAIIDWIAQGAPE